MTIGRREAEQPESPGRPVFPSQAGVASILQRYERLTAATRDAEQAAPDFYGHGLPGYLRPGPQPGS